LGKTWEIVEKEDKQAWDAFVASSPQRSIFVQTRFLDALLADYRLVTCREDGEIVAGVAIMLGEDGKPLGSVFPFTQYQGVLLADHGDLAAHRRLAREFKLVEFLVAELAERFGCFCLCQSWRLHDLRPFQWFNYHGPDKDRFRLDLRYSGVLTRAIFVDAECHLASVRSVRRQEYRKAVGRLQLAMRDDEETLAELYRLTFARQQIEVPTQEAALVRSILRHAVAGGFGRMACALLDGVPVSAVLFLYDDRTAYYLFGANDPEHRGSFGGTFLLMTMLRDAFDRGMQEVDLVGVNSPNRGDFKLSLNADLRPYFITTLGVP
jgi:hypothetical protein